MSSSSLIFKQIEPAKLKSSPDIKSSEINLRQIQFESHLEEKENKPLALHRTFKVGQSACFTELSGNEILVYANHGSSGDYCHILYSFNLLTNTYSSVCEENLNMISSILSIDNNLIALGYWNGIVKIWDMQNKKITNEFKFTPHHQNRKKILSFCYESKTKLFCGDEDGNINLLDLETNKCLLTRNAKRPVNKLFNLDNQYLISSFADDYTCSSFDIWRKTDLELIKSSDKSTRLFAITSDNNLVIQKIDTSRVLINNTVVHKIDASDIFIIDPFTFEEKLTIPINEKIILGCTTISNEYLAYCDYERMISIYDLEKKAMLTTCNPQSLGFTSFPIQGLSNGRLLTYSHKEIGISEIQPLMHNFQTRIVPILCEATKIPKDICSIIANYCLLFNSSRHVKKCEIEEIENEDDKDLMDKIKL